MHDDYDEIEHAALMEDLIIGNSGVANARAEQRRREQAKRDRTIRHAAIMAGSAYLGYQAKREWANAQVHFRKYEELKQERLQREEHARAVSADIELMRTEAYALQAELADVGLNYINTMLERGPIRKWDIEDAQLWLYQFGRDPDLYATLVIIQNGFDFSKKTAQMGDKDFSKILEPFKRKVQRKGGKPYIVYSNQQYFFDDADIVRVNTEDAWDAALKTKKRVQGEIDSMTRQARNLPVSRSYATTTKGTTEAGFWIPLIIISAVVAVGYIGCTNWLGI
jgi:hypothetical protein